MVDGKCTNTIICDTNTQVCNMGNCVCKSGFVVVSTEPLTCKKVSCGNYLSGCGPNSECNGSDCICKSGYVLANATTAGVHPGCVLAPKSCQDFCKGPNQQCYGDICGCVSGYYFKDGSCVVIPKDENPIDCSTFSDCSSCNANLACGFCFNKETKVGNCISLKNQTCDKALISQVDQCSCLGGCTGGQVCTSNGCACNPPLQFIDSRCVDTANPCASITCRDSNEVCNNVQTVDGIRPICKCKEGMVRNSEGVCIEIPKCTDTQSCNCVTFPAGSVCCPSPTVPHLNEGETFSDPKTVCKYKCNDGTFTTTPESCPCPVPYVRDLVTNACAPPCQNGTAPKDGRCGTLQCSDGLSPNPEYPTKSSVPCGIFCLDGKFVLDKSVCEEACKTDTPPLYCPCPQGQLRDSTGKCVTVCSNGAIPIDGKCPTTNLCREGYPIKFNGTVVCGRECRTGEVLPNYIPCPKPPCSDGLVYDEVAQICDKPCANGAPPRNGVCVQCNTPSECCKIGVDGASVCGFAGCETGKVRNPSGQCVTPCSDGSLPVENIGCPNNTGKNCSPGFFLVNNECVTYCPGSNQPVKDVRACCPDGQYLSPTLKKCICKDGTEAINGVCKINIKCDPLVDTTCPCIYPLVRNSQNKCACPDEVKYPNPYDGNNCGVNPCGPGLTKNEGGSCVCVLTGRLPEFITKDGRNITICKCDPEIHSGCPLTPENCQGSTFKPCLCVLNNQCDDESTPSKEKCELDKTSKECFCRAFPNSADCTTPPLCSANPDHPSCVTKDNCTSQNYLAGLCTVHQFCEKHKDDAACKCLQPGSCSRETIRISENKTISDLLDANCTEADKSNKDKIECFCKFNYHPICICVIDPSKPGCSSADGSGKVPVPEAKADDGCKIISSDGTCSRTSSKTESDKDLKYNNAEVTGKIKDSVVVQIMKSGKPGLLFIERDASLGTNADPNAKVDSSSVKVKVGIMAHKCYEYIDQNLDGKFGDGDIPVKEVIFKDLTWTVSQTTNELGFSTITFSAMDGHFNVIYVVSTKEVTIDGVVKKARSNKMSLDIEFPFEKMDGKLGCDFKIYTKVELTANGNLLSVGGKANINFELSSQSGSTNIDVTQTAPVETTNADAILKVESDDRIYTVSLFPNAFAPSSWHYDPDISTSDTSAVYSVTPTSAPTSTPTDSDSSAVGLTVSWTVVLLSFVLYLFF